MKREEVKGIVPGITDEQLAQIMDLHGADIERQKQIITTLTTERDAARAQLGEANKKLEGYDPEWKSKAEEAQKDADLKVQGLQREYALKEQTAALKFSSESARKAFLADLSAKELPMQDGKLLGLDDFVKTYKEGDPAAFASDEKPPRFSAAATGATGGGASAKDQANAAFRAVFGHKD